MSFTKAPYRYRRIISLEERAEALRNKAQSVSAFSDSERVQTSLPKDRTVYLDCAADVQREIDTEKAILKREQDEARTFMNSLDDSIERSFIRLRYIECRTMNECAEVLSYSERQIYSIKHKLLG